jgi:hypothetical protein
MFVITQFFNAAVFWFSFSNFRRIIGNDDSAFDIIMEHIGDIIILFRPDNRAIGTLK